MDKTTGKLTPLWQLTRQGEDIVLPTRKVKIYDIKLLSSKEIPPNNILSKINKRLDLVSDKQDLRQDEIKLAWKKLLEDSGSGIIILKLKAKVSSGTYIRNIGKRLGGTCYDICRIGIGDILEEEILTEKYNLSYKYISRV